MSAFAGKLDDGFRAWAAFECAAYATVARHDPLKIVKPQEERRLFELGLRLARRFAKTVRSGKYKRGNLPDPLAFSLTGPSIEFIAGRIAENAQISAFRKIRQETKSYDWTSRSGEKAREYYLQANCRLID
jgi:hypothetical protein